MTRTFTPEHRAKLSEAKKGRSRRPQTRETREKIRLSLLGRKHSPERRANNSAGHRGKKLSDEQRKKLSEAHKGRIVTDETRRKISAANTGRVHGPPPAERRQHLREMLTDREFTPEHRENISKGLKGVKVGNKWIVNELGEERHPPYDAAADLVAAGDWTWGRATGRKRLRGRRKRRDSFGARRELKLSCGLSHDLSHHRPR